MINQFLVGLGETTSPGTKKKGIKCECGSHGSAHEAGTRWFLLVSPHAPPCESGFPGRQIEAMKGAPHLGSKAVSSFCLTSEITISWYIYSANNY